MIWPSQVHSHPPNLLLGVCLMHQSQVDLQWQKGKQWKAMIKVLQIPWHRPPRAERLYLV